MTTLMMILGIVVFVVGLLISIAWHELGHLSTAKLFGIRVPQYMVGFGPTIWSRKKGDTEYGIKAIPLGGYIRMIGMFPPGPDGRIEARSTSPFRGMIEDARSAAFEELQPGDETRLFYTRKPWKRVIVMFAGPFMNLILAVAIFLGVMMTFGIQTQTTTVGKVSDCVIQQSENRTKCQKSDTAAPAKAAGLQGGDKIVAFNGETIDRLVRPPGRHPRQPRQGRHPHRRARRASSSTCTAHLIENQVSKTDGDGGYVEGEYVYAGFLGFTPASGIVQQSFGAVRGPHGRHDAERRRVARSPCPAKVPALWDAAFGDGPREADSPMGVVGAARVGGEVFTLDIPPAQQIAMMLFLVAGFNLSLFLFNMLPLLPARRRAHRGRPVGVAAPEPGEGAAAARPRPVRRGEADARRVRGGRDLHLLHDPGADRGRG